MDQAPQLYDTLEHNTLHILNFQLMKTSSKLLTALTVTYIISMLLLIQGASIIPILFCVFLMSFFGVALYIEDKHEAKHSKQVSND
jgi:ABC-type multidrug transport system permease subunit